MPMTTKNSAIFLIAFLLASCDSNINYIQPSQPLVTNYVQSQPKPIVRTPLCDSNCVSNINNIIFHSEKKVYPPIKVIIYKDININEVKKRINENKEGYELLDKYLTEEEKTKLSMDISEKVFDYCDEIAMQSYESVQKEEKCKSYVWMENKIKQRISEEQKNSQGEIDKQVQTCMNNPKECN